MGLVSTGFWEAVFALLNFENIVAAGIPLISFVSCIILMDFPLSVSVKNVCTDVAIVVQCGVYLFYSFFFSL